LCAAAQTQLKGAPRIMKFWLVGITAALSLMSLAHATAAVAQ
jgi:hypothetical protein